MMLYDIYIYTYICVRETNEKTYYVGMVYRPHLVNSGQMMVH